MATARLAAGSSLGNAHATQSNRACGESRSACERETRGEPLGDATHSLPLLQLFGALGRIATWRAAVATRRGLCAHGVCVCVIGCVQAGIARTLKPVASVISTSSSSAMCQSGWARKRRGKDILWRSEPLLGGGRSRRVNHLHSGVRARRWLLAPSATLGVTQGQVQVPFIVQLWTRLQTGHSPTRNVT